MFGCFPTGLANPSKFCITSPFCLFPVGYHNPLLKCISILPVFLGVCLPAPPLIAKLSLFSQRTAVFDISIVLQREVFVIYTAFEPTIIEIV